MPATRPARLRLFDILDAIAGIERVMLDAKKESREPGADNWRLIERWLEIVSEASRHVPEDMKQRESEIAWRQIANLGNVIRHGYDRIAVATLKVIVEDEIPPLKTAAERLYAACKLPADPWP